MSDYYQLGVPVIGLTVNVIVQILTARADPETGYFRSVVHGFGAGLISPLAIGPVIQWYQNAPWQELAAIMLVNTATYVSLVFCFLMGFVLNARSSIRVRIFKEVQRSKNGLSLEQLLAVYSQRKLVEMRLERFLKTQHFVLRAGRYYLNSSFLRVVAAIVRFLKILVIGKDFEFPGMTAQTSHQGETPDADKVRGRLLREPGI
jgi:hypothetical protein